MFQAPRVLARASQCLLRLLSVFWEAFQTFIAASILIWPVARKLGTYGSWAEGGNCLPVLFHGIIIMIVTWKVNKLCFRFFFIIFLITKFTFTSTGKISIEGKYIACKWNKTEYLESFKNSIPKWTWGDRRNYWINGISICRGVSPGTGILIKVAASYSGIAKIPGFIVPQPRLRCPWRRDDFY